MHGKAPASSPVVANEMNEQPQQLRITIDDAISQGEYINFANIIHSPSEFVIADERNEFEQTSSARLDVWCAGVIFIGRISKRSTVWPRCAS